MGDDETGIDGETRASKKLHGQFDWAPSEEPETFAQLGAQTFNATPQQPDTKLPYANPKDAIGSTKLPLHLVPDSLTAFASLAFAEGALKYGAYNWRCAPVRASIYVSALRRHLAKWLAGEERDEKTSVPHLASMLACIGIIADAQYCGTLIDDRPPSAHAFSAWVDVECTRILRELEKHFGDVNPHHCTIDDSRKDSDQ